MDKPWFFSDKPGNIFFTKSPHIKVLLVNKLWFWWVHYHLRTVIRNPRRNVELTMGRFKWKHSKCHVTLFDALINKSRCAFFNSLHHSIESKAISLSPISKITVDLNVYKLIVSTTKHGYQMRKLLFSHPLVFIVRATMCVYSDSLDWVIDYTPHFMLR